MGNKAVREKRERLWTRQKGRCHWCRGLTVLPKSGEGGPVAPNTATLEHLIDRYSPERWSKAQPGERRVVMACSECNNRRARMSNKVHKASRPMTESTP